MQPVTLPESGYSVRFKPHYTHRVERAFKEALSKGLTLRQEGGQMVVDTVSADALDRAVEAALEHLVESITKDGQTTPFSVDWLLELPERDFDALRQAVNSARDTNEGKKAAGKKNP